MQGGDGHFDEVAHEHRPGLAPPDAGARENEHEVGVDLASLGDVADDGLELVRRQRAHILADPTVLGRRRGLDRVGGDVTLDTHHAKNADSDSRWRLTEVGARPRASSPSCQALMAAGVTLPTWSLRSQVGRIVSVPVLPERCPGVGSR